MADDTEDDPHQRPADDVGQFYPAHQTGIPVGLAGTRRQAEYGKLGHNAHPPLACPAPQYTATIRGFYRCPGCGIKIPLAGQVRAAEWGQEAGERWAGALASGTVQAFWMAVDLVADLLGLVHWVWRKLRRRKQPMAPPELVAALVMIGKLARNERKPCQPNVSGAAEIARWASSGSQSPAGTSGSAGNAQAGSPHGVRDVRGGGVEGDTGRGPDPPGDGDTGRPVAV